jgi:hypothetical protein
MNRFFRRMQRFGKRGATQQSRDQAVSSQSELVDAGTPQDVASARAKNQRHGKVTADKWNQ